MILKWEMDFKERISQAKTQEQLLAIVSDLKAARHLITSKMYFDNVGLLFQRNTLVFNIHKHKYEATRRQLMDMQSKERQELNEFVQNNLHPFL